MSSPTCAALYFWEEEWRLLIELNTCPYQEQSVSVSVFFPSCSGEPSYHDALQSPNVDSGCVDELQKPRISEVDRTLLRTLPMHLSVWPLGMCLQLHASFFCLLRTKGCEVYVSDKVLFSATARHLCVRHALAYAQDFVGDSEMRADLYGYHDAPGHTCLF